VLITKISLKDEIAIDYDLIEKDSATRKVKFKCDEKASPSFYREFAKLIDYAVKYCALDKDKWYKNSQIVGITCKHIDGDDGGIGITISAINHDLEPPANITTPYLEPGTDYDLERLAEQILILAEKYVNGERQTLQVELFKLEVK
jgi:hypothetical protein